MQPKGSAEIPAETVRVARAAFPMGSLAIRVRDELGLLFTDEEFVDLFPVRGRPAWSPGRLALVLVLQHPQDERGSGRRTAGAPSSLQRT